jgi:excisionase family DNA binding protein
MLPELPPDGRLGLRPAEVAAMLGVAPGTIIKWIHTGQLPATRFGHTWIISPAILQTLLGVPGWPGGRYT